MISHTLKTGTILRPAVMNDANAVIAMQHAVSLKMVGTIEETLEDLLQEWSEPGFDLATNTRVAIDDNKHDNPDLDEQMIGYAIVYDVMTPETVMLDIYTPPDRWGTDTTTEPALLDWAIARAGENISRIAPDVRLVVRGWAHTHDTRYGAVLEAAGLHPIRHSFRMQIELDQRPAAPEIPDGITIRTVQPGEDWRPIYEARTDAWRDHWGYVERPMDEAYQHWLHFWNEHYVEGAWLLAMDGDEIAGVSLCIPALREDPELGWVGTLAVRRPYRRQGVAMALLKSSFVMLYDFGRRKAGLGVDGGSLTGATRLYERAGMRQVLSYTLYEREIRPGIDLSTQNLQD